MGGAPAVRRLVEAFYPKVQAHPLLAPLFPEDIYPVMDKQELFLTQFFGGPPRYTMKHGHPMMRARHLAFPITAERADAWLACMKEALEETIADAELRKALWERLKNTAYFFINTESDEAEHTKSDGAD
ncbi:globin domain-containing protein [Gorillibacterium timonense]|uniref:globin domain-containing protein n=1 Tax=Gorillibacterium timonense TaxID=1689269 RepID=UPI00071D00B4|nr:globin [Gorillibacterium timonense]